VHTGSYTCNGRTLETNCDRTPPDEAVTAEVDTGGGDLLSFDQVPDPRAALMNRSMWRVSSTQFGAGADKYRIMGTGDETCGTAELLHTVTSATITPGADAFSYEVRYDMSNVTACQTSTKASCFIRYVVSCTKK